MITHIDEKGVLSIMPQNKYEDKQIRKFYKKNKGKPIETVIQFNVLSK